MTPAKYKILAAPAVLAGCLLAISPFERRDSEESTVDLPRGTSRENMAGAAQIETAKVKSGAIHGTRAAPAHSAQTAPATFVADLLADARANAGRGIEFSVPGGLLPLRGIALPPPDGVGGFIEGRITHPKPGRFVFSEEDLPSVTGPLFGFVLFDDGSPGYRIEPLGEHGAPMLVEVPASDIICTGATGNLFGLDGDVQAMRLPDDHPQNGAPNPPPEYQNGTALFSSRPGSRAVLYLDFDGEKGPFVGWGDFDAEPSGFSSAEIHTTWLEVAEDFLPFNYNVTTDLAAYHAAPNNSRMRCIITPTTDAWDNRTGVVGVAYRNTFNSSADYVCWSLAVPGGQVGQIISHELGHTLRLRHDGSQTDAYYRGHGAGPTSWGPIMGSALMAQMRQWSKGEYGGANEHQDDIKALSSENNRAAFNSDGPGNDIANAVPLHILDPTSGQVDDQEIIEHRGDQDVFWFRSKGGTVNLAIDNATTYQNLDIEATLLDSTGAVVISDNPANLTTASIALALLPGDYYLQIDGVGYADPYQQLQGFTYDGYTDYGSIGAYKITGTVANSDPPQRIEVAENTPTSTIIGTVQPNNAHGVNPLTYAATGGNELGLFAVEELTGTISVASAINYEGIAGNWTTTPEVLLEVAITDTVDSGLDETVIVRLPVTDVNEPPAFTALPNVTIYETTDRGKSFASATAKDEDFFQRVTYSITAGDPSGYFSIHADSGALSLAAAPPSGVTYNLTVQVVDSAIPAEIVTGTATVSVDGVPPGFVPSRKPLNPARYLADSVEQWDPSAPPTSPWNYGADDGSGFVPLDTLSGVGSIDIGGSAQARSLSGMVPMVSQFAAAPDAGTTAVRRWTSDFTGLVKIAYDAMRLETVGDGQAVAITHDGSPLWSATLDNANPHQAGELIAVVAVGDTLDFNVADGGAGDAAGDWTHFHARIIDRYRSTEDAGLLFRYACDESDLQPAARGGVALDSTGNGNHGTVEGAAPELAWSAGEIDHAGNFDGANDAISTDANNIGDDATAFTLSAWIRPDTKTALDPIFCSSGVTTFKLDLSDTGVGQPVRFTVGATSVVGPDNSGPADRWTHVVGVWQTGGAMTLYLDGVEAATLATGPTLVANVDKWLIGRDAPILPLDPTHYFDGRIDDVALWSRALDAAEVRALHSNGKDVFEFAGTASDYITLDHSPVRDGATELTLSAWYKPLGKDNNDAVISSTGPSYFSLIFSGNGSGQPAEFRAQSNSLVAEDNTGPVGQWTHATGVWKSGEFQRLFLNGVEVSTSPSPSMPSGSFDIEDWIFGRDRLIDNRYYHGSAGELLIMERALDADGVAALHRVGRYNTGATRAAFDRSDDIGAPTAAGRFEELSGRYLINAAGGGFTGSSDAGHLLSRPHDGDGAITAFIDSVENVSATAAAGVMVRESTAAGSPFVFVFRTPSNGVGMSWRDTADSAVQSLPTIDFGGEPGWVRVARRGHDFIGLHSTDGETWSRFGTASFTMATATRLGLATSSGDDPNIGSAYFADAGASDLGADADLDGLVDLWEDTHFGGLSTTDGDTDIDGDGNTERDEFITGHDPNSGSSRFAPVGVVTPEGEQIDFTWNGAEGRTYTILTSETLEPDSWVLLEDQIPAELPTTTYRVPRTNLRRFYIVETTLGPPETPHQ